MGKSYVVAICCRPPEECPHCGGSTGHLRVEHEMTMLHQMWPMGWERIMYTMQNYGIGDARNLAIKRAFENESDYIMFWDDDVLPRQGNAFANLLNTMDQNPHIDILGGVYPRRSDPPEPIVCETHPGGVWWGWEDGKIHKVYMTGTGFTIIRLASLKKMDVPKRRRTINGKREVLRRFMECEEIGGTDDFHLAAEAVKAGLTWYVHGGVVCDQMDLGGKRYSVDDARVRVG